MTSPYPSTLDSDSTLYVLDDILVTHLASGSLSSSSTTVTVLDTTNFPPYGLLAIYDPSNILGTIEYVSYTGKTPTTFTGVSRGINTRFPAKGHGVNETVAQEFLAEHYAGLKSAIQNIETTLGTNVQRSYANVDLRIAAIESALTGVGIITSVTATSNIVMPTNSRIYVEGATPIQLRLPSVSSKNDSIEIVGTATGNGFTVTQGSGQYIVFSGDGTVVGTERTSTGTGGSMAPDEVVAVVELVCTVANTEWTVLDAKGGVFTLT